MHKTITETNAQPPYATVFGWVVAMLLLYHVGQALYHSLDWPIYHDSPVNLYIARRILSGDIPYHDVFDVDMPGTYLIYLWGERIFGFTDRAFRYFDGTFVLCGSIAIALFCRYQGAAFRIAGGLVFVAYHLSLGPAMAGERDMLMVPFLILAGDFTARHMEAIRGGWKWPTAAGLLLGYAVLIKPLALIWALFLFVALACRGLSPKHLGRNLPAMLCLAGGMAISAGMVIWWLWYRNGLEAWLDTLLHYLPLYREHYFSKPATYPWRLVYPFCVGALATLLAGSLILGRRFFDIRSGLALAGIVYGLLHLYLQHKGWTHHFYPLAAFATAFIAYNIPRLTQDGRTLWPLGAALFFAVGIRVCSIYPGTNFFFQSDGGSQYLEQMINFEKEQAVTLEKKVEEARAAVPQGVLSGQTDEQRSSLQFFDAGGCGPVFSVAYRHNWKLASRYFFFFVFEPEFLKSDNSPWLELLDKMRAAPPNVVIFSWCAAVTLYRIQHDPAFAKFFGATYNEFFSNGKYEIYIRKQ